MKIYAVILLLTFKTSTAVAQEPKGLQVNSKAPEFSAKDQSGKWVTLSEELKKGPVVVVFYRGQWCPYCNRQLSNLQDSLTFITARGASLIAISPEVPENVAATVKKTNASYPVLFDDSLKILKNYDVAFDVDSKTIEKYKGYGIDFGKVNGDNGAVLPVPSVYIINSNGIITYKYFDKDFSKRVSVKEIADHL